MRPARLLVSLVLVLALTPILLTQESPVLRVHFVDVGQGDGVLIQAPAGSVVYDAGESPDRMRDYLASIGATTGLIIASHNHADHIGGLASMLASSRPPYYMDNGVPASTQTYARVLEAARAAGSELLEPITRQISLGEVMLRVIAPPGIPDWDQNDNSIAV